VKHFPFLSTSIFLGIVVLLLTSLASLQSWHKHLSQFLTTDSTALVQDTTTMGYTTCHSSLTGRPPRPKVSTLPSNYLPQHGFNPISPHITTNTTVIQHLQHYFGTQNMPSLLYFITPTYRRHTQMADLLRLSYTLDHDLAIYWIVVEDADHCSLRVRALLEQTPLSFAHVYSPSPTDATARGVSQRNRALQVVEQVGLPGVVYFGDDDNAYDGTSQCVERIIM
jgi:galactosylgalactosylxylosylprotein 3-beta-glucuronosyltransferase 3